MEITLHEKQVRIDNFSLVPNNWIWDEELTDGDKIKLMKLYWRYDFFRSVAYKTADLNNKPKVKATNYMYETQEAYADLLKIPRSKVSSLFKRLEDLGHIVRIKGGTQKIIDGVLENIPRDYVIVFNKFHKDYNQDLQDVWIVLSQRLNTLESKGKTNQVTYKQMLKSYSLLFGDKCRYTKEEEEEVNFGIVSDCSLDNPPMYELPPINSYAEDYEIVPDYVTEEMNGDYLSDFGYNINFDTIDPPF